MSTFATAIAMGWKVSGSLSVSSVFMFRNMTDGEFKVLMGKDRKLMGYVIDWKNEIGAIAGPFLPTDTKQSWLGRAARRCAVSVRHITSLYYGHVTDPRHSVAISVLSAAEQARLEQAKQNVQSAVQIYRTHTEALERIDPDFYREHIDLLVGAARELGNRDRS